MRLLSMRSAMLAVIFLGMALFAGCAAGPTYDAAHPPMLKDIYAKDFLIGTACDPSNYSDVEVANIKAQFNVITPENCMKPGLIHPAEDTYNFGPPDTLVQWCEENHIQVVGHNLCWHAQTGNWFFQGADGGEVARAVLLERFRLHIMTVVGRYQGRLKGWDVVNEAISDGGNATTAKTENLRSSNNWTRIIGPEYLTLAFKWAHAADPYAELYYNDYNIERGFKHQSSLVLLKRLIRDGAPITGVGIQGHWSLNSLPYKELDQAISDYKALGLKVNITELDITITGQGGGQLTPSTRSATGPATQTQSEESSTTAAATNPTTEMAATGPATTRRGARGFGAGRGFGRPSAPPTPAQLQAQADGYAKLFKIFLKHKDVITRVTFWGINDTRSWRAGQSPLLFDRQNEPKVALYGVANARNSLPFKWLIGY